MLKKFNSERLAEENDFIKEFSDVLRGNIMYSKKNPDGVSSIDLPSGEVGKYKNAKDYIENNYKFKSVIIYPNGDFSYEDSFNEFLKRAGLHEESSSDYLKATYDKVGYNNVETNDVDEIVFLRYVSSQYRTRIRAEYDTEFLELIILESEGLTYFIELNVAHEHSASKIFQQLTNISNRVFVLSDKESELGSKLYRSGNYALPVSIVNTVAAKYFTDYADNEVPDEIIDKLSNLYDSVFHEIVSIAANTVGVEEDLKPRWAIAGTPYAKVAGSMFLLPHIRALEVFFDVEVSSETTNTNNRAKYYHKEFSESVNVPVGLMKDKIDSIMSESNFQGREGVVFLIKKVNDHYQIKIADLRNNELLIYAEMLNHLVYYSIVSSNVFGYSENGSSVNFKVENEFTRYYDKKKHTRHIAEMISWWLEVDDVSFIYDGVEEIDLNIKPNKFIKYSNSVESIKMMYAVSNSLGISKEAIRYIERKELDDGENMTESGIDLVKSMFNAIRMFVGDIFMSDCHFNLSEKTKLVYGAAEIDMSNRRVYCDYEDLEGDQVDVFNITVEILSSGYQNKVDMDLNMRANNHKDMQMLSSWDSDSDYVRMSYEELVALSKLDIQEELALNECIAYSIAKRADTELFDFDVNYLEKTIIQEESKENSIPLFLNKQHIISNLTMTLNYRKLLTLDDLKKGSTVEGFVDTLDLEFLKGRMI